jgi:hypothetical protein
MLLLFLSGQNQAPSGSPAKGGSRKPSMGGIIPQTVLPQTPVIIIGAHPAVSHMMPPNAPVQTVIATKSAAPVPGNTPGGSVG